MRALLRFVVSLLAPVLLSASAAAQETPAFIFDQAVDDDGVDYFLLDFEVPAGIVEIEVQHASVSDDDVIDFGLEDPAGFRGSGGGSSEPAVVGVDAASRGYRPGPIAAGTWHVVVGKAQLLSAAPALHVEVFLRTVATLPPVSTARPMSPPPCRARPASTLAICMCTRRTPPTRAPVSMR